MPDTPASALAAAQLTAQVFAFAFGACIGSFLNVVIARLPENLSIVRPPSRCPHCMTPIAWYDNVPVLGWLWLRGRCRSCKAPISIRYPTVELLVGLLGVSVYRLAGPTPNAVFLFVFVALLVAITYIDLDHWIIPVYEMAIPGIVVGVAGSFFNPRVTWFDSLVGGVCGFAIFALIALLGRLAFKKEALGQGDWWLLAMIGATLGWKSLLPVVLLASLQGSIIGVLLIIAGRSEKGEESAPHANPSDEKGSPPVPAVDPSVQGGSATVPPDPTAAAATAAEAPGDGEEDDWVPPRNAVPFGPFLALGALEQLFLPDSLRMLYEDLLRKLTGS